MDAKNGRRPIKLPSRWNNLFNLKGESLDENQVYYTVIQVCVSMYEHEI